jgi:hypothetical protein
MTSPAERLARALPTLADALREELRLMMQDDTHPAARAVGKKLYARIKPLLEAALREHDASASAQGDWQPIETAPLDMDVLVFEFGERKVSRLNTLGSYGQRDGARWTGGVGDPWLWTELPPMPVKYRLAAAPAAPTAGEPVRHTRTCPQDGTCCSHTDCATDCQGHTS